MTTATRYSILVVSAAMPDETPIAWLALEPGTSIVASDGEEVGNVAEIVADRQQDIFSGVTFRPGFLDKELFIPADRIASMTAEAVRLNITSEAAGKLDPYPT
jgi:uncharacterized protein YrrD